MTRGKQASDIRTAIERYATNDERIAWLTKRHPYTSRTNLQKALSKHLKTHRLDSSEQDRDEYTHDEDAYTFRLAGEKPFDVPIDQVQEWVRWYVTDGAGVTQRTITRMSWQVHGRPLTKDYARRIFRCLGIDKSSPPFAPHLLAKYSPDELAKLHFSTAQADVEVRLRADEPREWRANWIRAERKLAELQRHVDESCARAEELAKRINRRAPERASIMLLPASDQMLLVPVYDAHVGKRALVDHADVVRVSEQMFARASVCTYERVTLVFGGDFFHIDNERGTTSGTPQDVDDDWVNVMLRGWAAAESIIELWRKLGVCLHVYIVPGNHDRVSCVHLAAGMRRIYRDCEDVHVMPCTREMQSSTYGSTLLVFEHGDGPKPAKLAALVANKFAEQWGQTRYRYVITGHLHHVYEHDDGITIMQQPSVSGTDRWHDKHGYIGAKRGMRAYAFDRAGGHTTTFQVTL